MFMLVLIDNVYLKKKIDSYHTNSSIHKSNTSYQTNYIGLLQILHASKRVSYSTIRIFNGLPLEILKFKNNKSHFGQL
jgi:hypothetical protein